MAPSSKSTFDAALALPPDEQVESLDRLLASVEVDHRDEIDRRWLDECDRRWEAHDKGLMKAIPGEQALSKRR